MTPFFLAFVLFSACGRAADAAPGPEGGVFPELETILSPAGPAREGLFPEVRARVTSPRHTILSSQAAGRIDSVPVRDGDRFAAGQILAEIDPTFELIQLGRAKANLQRQELLARMTEQLVRLQTKGELELELARADIRQAEAEVSFIEAKLERMRVSAPFPGRMGEVFVRELQIVSDGQPMLEVIDDSEMELEFIVSSQWLRWFVPGFAFEVEIDETGKRCRAVLTRLGGKVDPLSKSVNAYARLENPPGDLMEGMSGDAFITPPPGETPP